MAQTDAEWLAQHAQPDTSDEQFLRSAAQPENTRTGQPSPGIAQPFPDFLRQMIHEGGPSLLPILGQLGMTLATDGMSLPAQILLRGGGFAAGEGAKMLNTGDYHNAGQRLLEALGIGMGSEGLAAGAPALFPRPAAALQRSFGETSALAKQFPDVNLGQAAVEARVAPGAKGAKTALENVRGKAQQSRSLVTGAQAGGQHYTVEQLAQPQLRDFEQVHGHPPNATEKAGILHQAQNDIDAVLAEQSRGGYARGSTTYQPTQVARVVRRAGMKGQPVAKGSATGQTIPPTDMSLLSQGGREAMGQTITGYDAAQAAVQKARAVNIMAQAVKNRPMPWYPGKINLTQFPPNVNLRPDLAGQLALLATHPNLLKLLLAGRLAAGGALQAGLDADTTSAR